MTETENETEVEALKEIDVIKLAKNKLYVS